ncbi:MAG: hypothetical protein MUO23_07735 [Anaerolineales bacterium]|nr:hypothetical protein [Anaerolineales bacterium]
MAQPPAQARPSPAPVPAGILRTYRPPPAYRTLLWGIALAAWIVAAILAVIGLWRWGLAVLHYGPVVVWPWSAPWFAAATAVVVLSLWLTFNAFGASGRAVHELRTGLLIEGRRERTHVPWTAVSGIYTSAIHYLIPMLSTPRLTIELLSHSGRSIRLPAVLSGADHLVSTIKVRTYPRLLEEYRQAFNTGAPLHFGPLELNRNGMQYGKETLAWAEVASVTLERGRLWVRPMSGRGWRIAVRRIPNAEVCLQLASHLGSGA